MSRLWAVSEPPNEIGPPGGRREVPVKGLILLRPIPLRALELQGLPMLPTLGSLYEPG